MKNLTKLQWTFIEEGSYVVSSLTTVEAKNIISNAVTLVIAGYAGNVDLGILESDLLFGNIDYNQADKEAVRKFIKEMQDAKNDEYLESDLLLESIFKN